MNDFLIALLGDGTFDKWGDDCPELSNELSRLYTQSSFTVQNHGLLNSRVGNGLWRVAADYEKEGSKRRHLAFFNPDVVIVESFAYTQFWDGPEGLGEYRDLMRHMWEEIERTTTAKRLFCLAAPPHRDRFLEGARNYQNTSEATRARFADGVKLYLDEARVLATDEGWPIADIGATMQQKLDEGESPRRFFDQNDSLYPSRLGYSLAARAIVRALDNGRMVEERIAK